MAILKSKFPNNWISGKAKMSQYFKGGVKKYICIGGTYQCSKTNKCKKITPKKLAELYRLDSKECIFFFDENRFQNPNHRMKKFGITTVDKHYYILRTRKAGDYIFHIARLKAARLLENKPI